MTTKIEGSTDRVCSRNNNGQRPRHAMKEVMAEKMLTVDSRGGDNTATKRTNCITSNRTAINCLKGQSSNYNILAPLLHTSLAFPRWCGRSLSDFMRSFQSRNGSSSRNNAEDAAEINGSI